MPYLHFQFPPYLHHFLLQRSGYRPTAHRIHLRPHSPEHLYLALLLIKPPPGATPTPHIPGSLSVRAPTIKNKPATTYSYLPLPAQHAYTRALKALFDIDMLTYIALHATPTTPIAPLLRTYCTHLSLPPEQYSTVRARYDRLARRKA